MWVDISLIRHTATSKQLHGDRAGTAQYNTVNQLCMLSSYQQAFKQKKLLDAHSVTLRLAILRTTTCSYLVKSFIHSRHGALVPCRMITGKQKQTAIFPTCGLSLDYTDLKNESQKQHLQQIPVLCISFGFLNEPHKTCHTTL